MSTQDNKPDTQISDEDEFVVLPTRKYVKDAIHNHALGRGHPDATLKDKGFVVLNNDFGSDSETTAATPKAVKAAYDLANMANQNAVNANNNANARLEKNQNGGDIPDKKEFVKNLGLSEIVYKTVGNGPNQIPDMSFFTSGPNWFKMPDGRIIQYGTAWFSRENVGYFYADAHFPIPFPNELSCMFVTLWGVSSPSTSLFHLASDMNSKTWAAIPMRRPTNAAELPNIPTTQSAMWLAIGY
ncbi:tail fiber protein [Xenorhabdus sp. 42]|uniref:tail fiber protein n=1 Tax=Xenorhabdus szentirmaii TaxID=290112 RepID=UPI000C052159|nr:MULTISPECIES: phage tail protein [Xenorhabdus]MBD2782128.1 tail fiber protein [Xenorhabdus sp. 38]MBD2822523.1 tail fiber protein [Xenorhabdus sp. 42]PHM41982.1 tail protein [Xenorhabdus szentirmaii]